MRFSDTEIRGWKARKAHYSVLKRLICVCVYVLTLTYNCGLSFYLFGAYRRKSSRISNSYRYYLKKISHDTLHTERRQSLLSNWLTPPLQQFQFHSKWQLFVICHGIIELTFLSLSRSEEETLCSHFPFTIAVK